jgi:hypothetical protein
MFKILTSLLSLVGLDGTLRILAYGGMITGVIFFVNSIQNIRADNVRLKHQNITLQSNVKVRELELSMSRQALTSLSKQCRDQATRFLRENDIWKKIDASKDPLTDAANFQADMK